MIYLKLLIVTGKCNRKTKNKTEAISYSSASSGPNIILPCPSSKIIDLHKASSSWKAVLLLINVLSHVICYSSPLWHNCYIIQLKNPSFVFGFLPRVTAMVNRKWPRNEVVAWGLNENIALHLINTLWRAEISYKIVQLKEGKKLLYITHNSLQNKFA